MISSLQELYNTLNEYLQQFEGDMYKIQTVKIGDINLYVFYIDYNLKAVNWFQTAQVTNSYWKVSDKIFNLLCIAFPVSIYNKGKFNIKELNNLLINQRDNKLSKI